ncbi:MAG: ABC transporter permease [Lachnospiraceae bacterium]|nr:ABC transporter permease [Lachnospiraceae bacterium]
MDIMKFLNAMPGACAQGLIWGIMAVGLYITYKVLDLSDLTVDGTMATGGAVCVMMMMSGHSVAEALLVSFIVGMLAGLVTGLFHTVMGIPAILAGILTQLGLYSINLRILGGKSNQALAFGKYDQLVSLRWVRDVAFYKNTIFVVVMFVLVIIALLYWFFGTELGSSIRSTGDNEQMSRAQGINTNITKVVGLMLANGIVALSSALYAQYQGFADVNAGRGAIVIGLAAVIIGEVIFGKLSKNFGFKLFTVVLGAIIYWIVYQVVIAAGMNANDMKLISALVVGIFLAVPHLKGRYFAKPVKRGGASHA